jgi:hypothetical protein
MKSVLCRIGKHDWEILQTKSANDIREKYNENNKCVAPSGTIYEHSTYFQNKICMRCDKTNNGIKKYEFLLFQLLRRREIAEKKYKEKED